MVSTRRSARLRQVTPEDAPPSDDGEDYGLGEQGSDPVAVRVPKSRASRRPVSKNGGIVRDAGKLSKLPDMPLDILYEIFSLVHPMDLLRVSWTNKTFRNVLTNNSSRPVWISGFKNIPKNGRPPPCPKDLTEIAYANLLYNPCCMGCGMSEHLTSWTARLRSCVDCLKNRVVIVGGVHDKAVVALSHGKLQSSGQILPTIPIRIRPLPKRMYVFTKDLNQLMTDLKETVDEAAVIQRYTDALVTRDKFAHALDRLDNEKRLGRGAMLRVARDGRINQILERLADEGWDAEILSHRRIYADGIAQVEGAYVARPLTEKAWEKMKAQVLEVMQMHKKEIEDQTVEDRCVSRVGEVKAIVLRYQSAFDPDSSPPPMDRVCWIPKIRKAIIYGTDEEFNACAKEVASRLPELASQYLEERFTKILALLPVDKRPHNSLATAWLVCRWPGRSLVHATGVLSHSFGIRQGPYWGASIGEMTFDHCVRGQWTYSSQFTFSEFASTVARKLIVDCCKDPESTTSAEMDSEIYQFVVHKGSGLVVHDWRKTLVYKFYDPSAHHRFLGPDGCLELMNDPNVHDGARLWFCYHCWCSEELPFRGACDVTLPAFKQHFRNKHGVDMPAEGADYFYRNRRRTLR